MGLEDLGDLLPKETIDKLYSDALSPAAKQIGRVGEDTLKALRLLTLPIQALGALQDRLDPVIDRIRKQVPEARRVDAQPEVVGPALERMRFIPEKSELWSMYEEVLTKAVDVETAGSIHPAFAYLISQLSADEARMVWLMRDRTFEVTDRLQLFGSRFDNRVIEFSDLPLDQLRSPDQMELYYSHLESLNLVQWPILNQTPIMEKGKQTGVRRASIMQLTPFGKLFAAACIPPEGFKDLQKEPS